jgi:hypothetical protein
MDDDWFYVENETQYFNLHLQIKILMLVLLIIYLQVLI